MKSRVLNPNRQVSARQRSTYPLNRTRWSGVRWAIVILALVCRPSFGATPIDVPAELTAFEEARIEAIAKASRSTLAVFGPDKAGGGGSGVVITSDGYALTNFHVAQPCGNYMRCGMNDGQLYDAVLVGVDPTGDLALIKLLGRNDFPPAEIANSDEVRVGDPCFAVGNPFLLATDLHPTVTYGIVSGVRRYQPPAAGAILEYTDCIQTDAAINPGNSGGPLFDGQGRLIGINGRGSFEKRGRVNVGVGYAISINQAMNFLGVLKSGRIVDHATLGATVSSDPDNHVVVSNILESSDAYRRGLRYGDQILTLAGREIDSPNTLKNVLGILPKGWRVPLTIERDGEAHAMLVRLPGLHTREELLSLTQRGIGPPEPEPDQPQSPAPDEDPDEEAPEDSNDDSKPEQIPPTPRRGPSPGRSNRESKTPEAIADVYEARRGYANFHFNKLERTRVMDAWQQHGNWEGMSSAWAIAGNVSPQETFQLVLEDESVSAKLMLTDLQEEVAISFAGLSEVETAMQPATSGGLYMAMFVWRRMMTVGPDRYGEVFYWGQAPLPGHEGLFDVVTGIYDISETRFYFSPRTGQLVALEMFPDADIDPCELYFDDYRQVDGRALPHQIEVRYQDDTFGTLKVESYKIAPAAQEDA